MEKMDADLQDVIQSYFDCGWEEFVQDQRVKETVGEMKKLADMYLKAKSSKTGDNMVATLAMEAELKRLKAELIELINTIKEENENQTEEQVELDEAPLEEVHSHEEAPVKVKSSKLPVIALGVSAVSLAGTAAAFFLGSNSYLTKHDFESYKATAVESVMRDVSNANQSVRMDIDSIKNDLATLKQDLEATKQDLGVTKQEMSDRVTTQLNDLTQRLNTIQATLNRPQKKPAVPATKSKKVQAKPKATRR